MRPWRRSELSGWFLVVWFKIYVWFGEVTSDRLRRWRFGTVCLLHTAVWDLAPWPFKHSQHTSGRWQEGAARLECWGEEESERSPPQPKSRMSAAATRTTRTDIKKIRPITPNTHPEPVLLLCSSIKHGLTFFSSSPSLCLISSRGARWVLARTHVYDGGWDRHASSFWNLHSASWRPTAANTWTHRATGRNDRPIR